MACTSAPAQTQATDAAATVIVAHTQIVPTAVAVQATVTAAAPTAQAVATRVAPTVQAASTSTVGALATSVALSPVQVGSVNVDSSDTTVLIYNSGPVSLKLDGYTLVMGPYSMTLEEIELGAGQSVTLHFSDGITTQQDVYLGFGSNVLSNGLKPGMRVVLVAPGNEVASVYTL